MKLLSPLPPMVISWVANLINVEGHPANLTIEEQEKNFRIVGGRPATIGEFPYQVSVQTYGSHVCGGSLISDRHVLTVASLTNQASPSSLSVRAGSSFRGRGGQVIKVQRICQDPSYYPRNNDHDDAVLLLHKFQLQFGSRDPVHQSRQARFQTSGRNVTGWGALSEAVPCLLNFKLWKFPWSARRTAKRHMAKVPSQIRCSVPDIVREGRMLVRVTRAGLLSVELFKSGLQVGVRGVLSQDILEYIQTSGA
ncbi:trypsin-4-like [Folsomia candida]|uniref:trypsin-4-like n=1 Tax=Folsomia candida TaxID=158441 RepID=UPI001604C395|nr:trypsin-4-like [Folsomia candida]